jgi:hypothetical protein
MFQRPGILIITLLLIWSGLAAFSARAQNYDLVILNGRVMDPESGLNAVRNIGVSSGKIETITSQLIQGDEVIDASGLVVAPGFIDLHCHGQDPYSIRISLRDGVTSALDLEAGVWPVDQYYAEREDKWQVNYGASVAHVSTRIMVMDGINSNGHLLTGGRLGEAGRSPNWSIERSTPQQLEQIIRLVDEGLAQGAIGIGFPVGYYTGVGGPEIFEVARLAVKYGGMPITTHVRYLSVINPSSYLGIEEMLAVATVLDLPLLVHHLHSNAMALTPDALALVDTANAVGHKVLAEAYPYTRGSSIIGARYLDSGFQQRTGMDYSDITWVKTMEPENQASFEAHRQDEPGGLMIMNHIPEPDMLAAITHPGSIIGSDGMPFLDSEGNMLDWNSSFESANGHPRGAGTHAKVLRMAREREDLTLMDAIAKMSYLPARFLEDVVPDMKVRGRLKPGAIADISIFDPVTVSDKAGWDKGTNSLPSTGIPFVIVNGTVVVKNSGVRNDVFPGQAIRNAALNRPAVSDTRGSIKQPGH